MAGDNLLDLTRALVYATLILSLVLLTGYSGQISLAQYVFFGLGAFAMGKVAGGDSILGMVAAAAIAVPLGVVIALPALRLQGLYLALVTFALAQVSRDVIFQDTRIYGLGGVHGRPPRGARASDFEGDEAFAVLCGLVFALVAIGVLALRRGLVRPAPGRHARQPGGLRHARARRAPHQAGGLRAVLGDRRPGRCALRRPGLHRRPARLRAALQRLLFLFAFVGGITTVTGALLGGLLFAALPLVQSEAPELAGLVFAAVAVTAVALGKQPNGMAGLLYSWRTRAPGAPPAAAAAPTATVTRPREVVDALA